MENPIVNKSKVLKSNFFVSFSPAIFIVILGILNSSSTNEDLGIILGHVLLSFIYGGVFWVPTILSTLVIETFVINKKTTALHIALLLIVEGTIAFLVISALFANTRIDFGNSNQYLYILPVFIGLPQLFRWIYLKHKGRMFEN